MRHQYRNGDDIDLKATGCDSCSPTIINGVLCHETGCPDAWRDCSRECKWCGAEFHPTEKYQRFCDDSCAESYNA
jgi:hypothetical protein